MNEHCQYCDEPASGYLRWKLGPTRLALLFTGLARAQQIERLARSEPSC